MCIFAAVPAAVAGASAAGAASAAAAGAAASAGLGAGLGSAAALGAAAIPTAWAITPTAALAMNAALGATIISGIGTPIYGYFAQSQAAKAQADYQNQMYQANKAIAEQSLLSQYADISRRQQQEQEKAAQEMGIISAQARAARATVATSAAESGVAGLSVDALMNDYFVREASALTATQRQLRGTMFQLEQAKKGLGAEYQGRVLGMTPQPIPQPSLIATGLQVGGAAAGLFSDIYLNKYDRGILRAGMRI